MRFSFLRPLSVLAAVLTLFVVFGVSASNTAAVNIALVKLSPTFTSPVQITAAFDGSGRLFVVEQAGKIAIIKNGQKLATPFLDITDRVSTKMGEEGLLSVAFAPNYEQNGRFYVYYTDRDSNNRVARFTRSSNNPDQANPASEQLVLKLDHPTHSNHNGGQLRFGPDNMLYIGTGDGGGGGDPEKNGQDLESLQGKMLRIDVETGNPATYTVPANNPFVGRNDARPEIWGYGLRNPWRFSFDKDSNHLLIGDVGQGAQEEINRVKVDQAGLNYGWSLCEGTLRYPQTSQACNTPNTVVPFQFYGRDKGQSITGGVVHRGSSPKLNGTYFYADYVSGRIWAVAVDGAPNSAVEVLDAPFLISSFGEDEQGEVYVVSYRDGAIYQIREPLLAFFPFVAR
jgi:glucose/arabinose dehydrogenase